MKTDLIQTNFGSGEVSPFMEGRVDTTKYAGGLGVCENMISRPQGPISRRCGSSNIRLIKNSAQKARLIPFQFSSDDTYMLEFGHNYIRFHKNEKLVVVTINIANVVDSGSGQALVTTAVNHGWATGNIVQIENVTGTTEINGIWRITVTALNQFIVEGPVFQNAYAGGGTAGRDGYEIVTPYSESEVPQINYTQSADVLYLAHPNHAPRELRRITSTTFELVLHDNRDGPWLDTDQTDTVLKISNLSDTAEMKSDTNIFVAGDVNKYVEYWDAGYFRLARITAVTDGFTATVNIVDMGQQKLQLDPEVQLSPKISDSTKRGMNRSGRDFSISNVIEDIVKLRQYFDRLNKISPGGSVKDRVRIHEPTGIDPQTKFDRQGAGPAIYDYESDHAATFSQADLGKFFRVQEDVWTKITDVINDARITTDNTGISIKAVAWSGDVNHITITPDSRVYTCTLTAENNDVFVATDVGRHVRLNYRGRIVWGKITAYTNARQVTLQLFTEVPRHLQNATRIAQDGRTDIWRLGAWSDTTGWPEVVTFHEQRLTWAKTRTQPHTFWMSRPGDFNKYSPSEHNSQVLDDNAITQTLVSNEVEAIVWMLSGPVLMIGTVSGEWQIRPSDSINDALTPMNITAKKQTAHGSPPNSGVAFVDNAILFLQRTGKKLRELTYNFELDKWVTRDLTLVSEHILRRSYNGAFPVNTKAVEIAYQRDPIGILWVRLEDGTLASMTYDKDQEIVSWNHHYLGEASDPLYNPTNRAVVESIACIPSSTKGEYILYMIVKRTHAGGAIRRHVEYITPEYFPTGVGDKDELIYLENTRTYRGPATLTPGGFTNGITNDFVHVFADGKYVGLKQLSATGQVNLTVEAEVVHVGFYSKVTIQVLPPEGQSPFGSTQGRTKIIDQLLLRVYFSHQIKHGPKNDATLVRQLFDPDLENLFSGDVRISLQAPWDTQSKFYLVLDEPYPLHLLAIMPTTHTNE